MSTQQLTHPPNQTAPLTTPETAAYLGVKPGTVETWRWNGRGPRYVKIGRLCRYRQADLDEFLNERVFSSTTEAQAVATGRVAQ